MSSNSYYFRRRTIGRAASPPTWACYEQIPYDGQGYSDSGSDSCSEDEEDYGRSGAARESTSDTEDQDHSPTASGPVNDADDIDMDMDEDGASEKARVRGSESQKDVKGKQRAVEPEPVPEPMQRHARKRQHHQVITLRPILTIQRSQGFVWNQDLFVPPYIKDRYIASTSPPNARWFLSTSASSTNSALTDYEVEVVEIRVREGELDDIIP